MVHPALLPLIRTPRLPVVDWTDAPADLNGLVRFVERRNLVSARVPSHFNWPLPTYLPTYLPTCLLSFLPATGLTDNPKRKTLTSQRKMNNKWTSYDITGLRLPTRTLRNCPLFHVSPGFKNCPTAKRDAATNSVCSDLDVFRRHIVTLRQIWYCY
jgi:hypothetical protein